MNSLSPGGWWAGYDSAAPVASGTSFLDNTATAGGGIGLDYELSLVGVAFGSGVQANSPDDIGDGFSFSVTLATTVTLDCTTSGCAAP